MTSNPSLDPPRVSAAHLHVGARPHRGAFVRRRRVGPRVFLVHGIRLIPITDAEDALWWRCDGHTMIGEMLVSQALASDAAEPGSAHFGAVAEAALGTLAGWLEAGCLTLAGDGAPGPETAAVAQESRADDEPLWDALMQLHHHQRAAAWDSGLDEDDRRAVVERFTQILLEYAATRDAGRHAGQGTAQFRADCLAQWSHLAESGQVFAAFQGHGGLQSWRYSRAERKITMVFRRSVYVGDIHSRL